MPTITVRLPKELKAFVDRRVAEGAHSTVSSFVTTLLKAEQKRRAEADLLRLVRDADASGPAEEWLDEDWKAIEKEVFGKPPGRRRARQKQS